MTAALPTPEWSNLVLIAQLGDRPFAISLVADATERAALAKRFDLHELSQLEAKVTLTRAGEAVQLTGHMRANATQACVISGKEVPAVVDEPLTLQFLPENVDAVFPDEEMELAADDCDIIWHDGRVVDVAEAVAQSFALALDPYPRAPDAEEIARAAGFKTEDEAGAFGALAALKSKMVGKNEGK